MIHRCNTTSFRSSHTNFFCNILSNWKLQIVSVSFPKRMVQIHLKDWIYLLHRIRISRNITILMYRRCGGSLHFCHCKASHSHPESFSEHWPSREGKEGRAFSSGEEKQFTSCSPRLLRRHESGHTRAPRGTQGLLLRDASELLRRPRSREPPGRVQGRAAARLGPRGPSRAGSARTHIPQRRSRQPPRSPRPDGRLREPGPRPRRRRRASSPRAGARPACQRGGRPSAAAAAPFLLSLGFLQPTPRPPPSPSPLSRGRTPPRLGWRRGLSRPCAAGSDAGAASGGRPSAADPGRPQASLGAGGRRHAPLRLRRPRGRSSRLGRGREAGRDCGLPASGGARGDSRGSPRA